MVIITKLNMEKACMLIEKLAMTIQLTAIRKPTSSASGCHYGQASRYLVGLINGRRAQKWLKSACYFWLWRIIQATPITKYMYIIKVCNKQVNYMNWLMAKYEYSVTQFGLCLGEGGGTKNIPYIEPHPHCTSKSHCPCHIFQQTHHCHQNLATWWKVDMCILTIMYTHILYMHIRSCLYM